jgi:hypothetical protein
MNGMTTGYPITCFSGSWIIPIIEGFEQNRVNITQLLALPYTLIKHSTTESFILTQIIEYLRENEISLSDYFGDPDVQDLVNRAIDPVIREQIDGDGSELLLRTDAARKFLFYKKIDSSLDSAQRSLYMSGIVFAWTMFESVAQETYHTLRIGRPDLNIPEKQVITGDDGTSREKSMDFTGVEGIKRAYRHFDSSGALKQYIWGCVDTKELATTRNQIVHSGGIVNRRFIELTKNESLVIGQPIPIDLSTVNRLVKAALKAGQELLNFIDQWVCTHPL